MWYIAPACGFVYLRFLLLSYKWKTACVAAKSPSVSWFAQREFHLLFLEMMFPLPNAEDMLRLAFMKIRKISWSEGLKTILLMRVSGVFVLCLLVLLFLLRQGAEQILGLSDMLLYSILTLVLFFLIFYRFVLTFINRFVRKLPYVGNLLSRPVEKALSMGDSPLQYVQLGTLSLLIYMAEALGFWVLLEGIGASIAFWDIYSLTPFLTLSFVLPLSIQGLGLPEAALVFLLPFYGLEHSDAAAVGVIHLGIYISVIICGGLLFLLWKEDDLNMVRQMLIIEKNG